MVANQLKQRRFIQFCEDLGQFFVAGTAFCKSAAVAYPQCADQCVAVLAADLTALVAVASINCHGISCPGQGVLPGLLGLGAEEGTGATGASRCEAQFLPGLPIV